ncbi:hypothetical protein QYM36_010154, partial [Artemia franciscana]
NVATLVNAVKDAKIKCPLHFGIVRHIPDDDTVMDLSSMIENCLKAERIRNTHSFNLFFESKADLLKSLEKPLTFGYEEHRIQEYRYLLMRCYNYLKPVKTLFYVLAAQMTTRTQERTLALRVKHAGVINKYSDRLLRNPNEIWWFIGKMNTQWDSNEYTSPSEHKWVKYYTSKSSPPDTTLQDEFFSALDMALDDYESRPGFMINL